MVMEVARAMGSTYSGDPVVDTHHHIFITFYHTTKLDTLSFPPFAGFLGSTQLHGFSQPDSIISSHPLPTLLKPELCFLTNSVWMSQEVGETLMVGSLPSSSVVSPQQPPSGASVSFLNGHLQVLTLFLTFCGQINHMYIYRVT